LSRRPRKCSEQSIRSDSSKIRNADYPATYKANSPGGWPADVDDDPAVGERDDRRLAIERHLAVEHVGVEAPRPADVGADDEVRDEDSLPGRRELGYR
jgi:hypothetical protein